MSDYAISVARLSALRDDSTDAVGFMTVPAEEIAWFLKRNKEAKRYREALQEAYDKRDGTAPEITFEVLRKALAPARCYACGKPAVCVGSYDGGPKGEFACGECCGHGNEDGTCTFLPGMEGS